MKRYLLKVVLLMALFIMISFVVLGCVSNVNNQNFDYSSLKYKRDVLETNLLNDIWGSSPSNVFVVGEKGTIYSYNGVSWEKTNFDTTVTINSIWGTSSDNIFAVTNEGGILNYNSEEWRLIASFDENSLVSIWGSSTKDIYAVGYNGFMVHFDGENWNIINSNTTNHLIDIWGISAQNIYAVGSQETIIHYDGKNWSTVTTDKVSRYMYTGIWGSAPDNILVVGNSPRANFIHFDGNSWDPILIDDSHILTHISGSSGSNIFAAGSNGFILHFNGEDWRQVGDLDNNFNDAYTYVWTCSFTDTFIIGLNGVVLHYLYTP